ncbi:MULTISPECIES: electron transfer flavoprotein subunit beta/FixA family protein [Ferrimicrobium]|jgi:electron transfer flavoprotein beta subunit|uniref:Electron transfer flavoprotein subunit beta n=1 Tax=Ferrimicrobium acidiphilum DSM 19497 TaxID=1121877 RepID=A0A0D8FV84_9ACTN|nr:MULTISPECIES: electron transfer flavoprotein subunit beta/FixA family protein [Ferrimicrobium]KJE77021.1 electron transfer flavoprotein subunit beta [Ferrimicrobium acidiphilum DSM 19497]
MHIVVAMRQLADLVEELEVDGQGTDIDRDFVKFVSNEWDEAALEEALTIKDESGAAITVVALDEPDVDQTLYAALAKGADRAVKLTGNDPFSWIRTRERAQRLASFIAQETFDLVLTGVQAADDLDGQLAGVLGSLLDVPHAAVVVGVESTGSSLRIAQELGGGLVGVSELQLPSVLGIQAARQAPRYASITRIRQAMQTQKIEEQEVTLDTPVTQVKVRRLYPPEKQGSATMFNGSAKDVAAEIVAILRSKGLVQA